MASEHIKADAVEVSEYPHIAVKYNVSGVPVTIINEGHGIVGGQPELRVIGQILAAIGK